jgi:XTP/dITP diphosphohydrolase
MDLIFNLASSNSHKAEEFAELLAGSGVQIIQAPKSLEVDETGTSFSENALLKAKAYYDEFNKPSLADDSGLVVTALPDQLGVHSARFAPEFENYKDKCEKLISLLGDKNIEERSAYFVCYLCFYLSPDEIYHFEGRVQGHIGTEYKGDHGFGYDPVFIPEGPIEMKTLAEVPEWKLLNSHRSRACAMAKTFFQAK